MTRDRLETVELQVFDVELASRFVSAQKRA
jgi:hypothetical protein